MQSDLTVSVDDMSEQQIIGKLQDMKKDVEDANGRTLRLGERVEQLKDFVQTDVNVRLVRVEERTSNIRWAVGIGAAAIIAMAVQLFLMNGRLSGIEQNVSEIRIDVSGMRLAQTATNPKDPHNIQEAKRVLTEAEKSKVRIPSSIVENTGKKFLEVAKDAPGAWDAALAFADYRSFLNGPNPPQQDFYPFTGGGPEIDKKLGRTYYAWHQISGEPLPQFTTSLKRVPIDISARNEPLGQPLTQTASQGPALLLGVGGHILLDSYYMRGIVLEGVTVHYDGGPVALENVTFINCQFTIGNGDNGRALGSQILASSSVNFKAPSDQSASLWKSY
jgi:hypothetical protein